MEKERNSKRYDLEDRTLKFAMDVRTFVKILPKSLAHSSDALQLVRSSGSVGSNYIEANDSLSKKDFIMRIKICRKESKESRFWLNLFDLECVQALEAQRQRLIQESTELMNIFGAILKKTQ